MERLHTRLKEFTGPVAEETNPVEDFPADENDGSEAEENNGSGTVSEESGN